MMAQCVCGHQLHQHTYSGKHTRAFPRGSWLLKHVPVVAHIAIKKPFELLPGSPQRH